MAVIALIYVVPPSGGDGGGDGSTQLAIWLISSIVCFALIFAVNSSIHSFLVVHYAKEDKVATSVGFYYMSNAVGRLLGTLGSGVLYTYAGEHRGDFAGSCVCVHAAVEPEKADKDKGGEKDKDGGEVTIKKEEEGDKA